MLSFFRICASLVLCCSLIQVLGERDFYQILGVSRDATESTIKKAFHKLSLKYHPDKNPGDEAAQKKFVEISEAHEVLGDPEKRQLYDMHGEAGLKPDQQNSGVFSFADLFGGGGGGRRKGPDFKMELSVTLEELYLGASKQIKLSRKVICPHCRGTGAKGGDTKKCKACNGQGVKTVLQQLAPGFNVQMQQPCEVCGGKGKMAKTVCPICSGAKLQMEEKALDAVVERGMPDGFEIVFERASEQQPDTIPGDVRMVLKTQKHSRFTRNGDDLHIEQHISLREALLGFVKYIVQLDGRRIEIKNTGVTPPGFVKIIQNEGMPLHNVPSDHGNLVIKFTVIFPGKLTSQQQQGIKALLQA